MRGPLPDDPTDATHDTGVVALHGSTTLDALRDDVAEVLHVEPTDLSADEDLFDRGLDSVRLMVLLGRWRARHTATLEFADLAERPELAHWARLLDGR